MLSLKSKNVDKKLTFLKFRHTKLKLLTNIDLKNQDLIINMNNISNN